jgi:hypothetical protein
MVFLLAALALPKLQMPDIIAGVLFTSLQYFEIYRLAFLPSLDGTSMNKVVFL